MLGRGSGRGLIWFPHPNQLGSFRSRDGDQLPRQNKLGRAVKCSRLPTSKASLGQRRNNITGLSDGAADLEEGGLLA